MESREEENDDVGTGRSYNCIFCKRGFTTAQALGGHMNIHRKDRVKSKPSSSSSINSNKYEENSGSSKFYQPISSYPLRYFSAHGAQNNYTAYYPPSTSDSRPTDTHHNGELVGESNSQRVRDGLGMDLSLQFGSLHREDVEKKKQDGIDQEDDELDLELRLGS